MLLSRWWYYASSLPRMAVGFRSPLRVAALCAGVAGRVRVVALKNGLSFEVRDALDVWIVKETCLDHQYERPARRLGPDWTVVDIGAGIGDFAIHAGRACPGGRVYAVEPASDAFALLRRNIERNRMHNVHALRAAVVSRPGDAVLGAGAHPLRRRAASVRAGEPTPSSVGVPGLTLEQVFEACTVDHCDFLKIDCEGCEYDVLETVATATMAGVSRICLEYHEGVGAHGHGDLIACLDGLGYATVRIPSVAHRGLGLLYARRVGAEEGPGHAP